MHREQIKALALANGFKLKQQPDGTEDLNPYVYEFAAALLEPLRTVNEIAISDLHSCKLALGKALQEQEHLQAQLNAAKRGMNSAKDAGAKMMAIGKKLAAENSPEAIESEREANAILTAENEALRKHNDELQRYNVGLADESVRLQAEVERLRAESERRQRLYIECETDNTSLINERQKLKRQSNRLKTQINGMKQASEKECDQLKAELERIKPIALSQSKLLQSGIVYTYEELFRHDAEVIERFVGGIINCIKAISPEISQHKNTLCIRELKSFRDTAIDHGVDSIQSTANQLRQQAKAQPGNDSCELECGAYGTYCRCRAEKAKEVHSGGN